MRLPKNNYELNKIFRNLKTSNVSQFKDEYFVDMLTGLPTLRKILHRKVFYHEKNRVLGYNVLLKNMIWGRFFLEEGICKEMDSIKVVVINYNRPENSFISNRIIDHVRCIEENALYLGRFNYLLRGKFFFLGYFSLLKIK